MVGGWWLVVGWVGGGKIKNKDQLSLAEARVEAELGKIDECKKCQRLVKI